jgi:AcrR family transcriptional regulator
MAQGGEVKARILRVAAQLFMEQGFAATSVREIGERAAVGQSSLYHHVRSKGHLLHELHQSFSKDLIERLTAVAVSAGSPIEHLRGLMRVVVSVVESHQPEVTVFLREDHALPEDARKEIQLERDHVDAIIDKVISDGIATGELRQDLDVRLTRLAVLGMCNWTYRWFRPDAQYSSAHIAESFADLVLDGLRARPGTGSTATVAVSTDPQPPGGEARTP